MRLPFTLAGICLGGALAACGGSGPAASTNPDAGQVSMQAKIERFRASNGLPGLAVVVIEQDSIKVATAGSRSMATPGAVQETDRFQLGSNTKAVTATLVARLVEQNKLRWDATLSELFPAWRSSMHPDLLGVTVEQLLHHRSGLKGDEDDSDIAQLRLLMTGDDKADRTSAAHFFLRQAPVAAPDTRYGYSNIGYLLLGLIAQTAGAGADYETMVAREVLAPLQMNGAFDLPDGAGSMSGHFSAGASWQVAQYSSDQRKWLNVMAPAAGLNLSMPDYGRFLRDQLRGLQGQSSFLSQGTYQRIHTPRGGYGHGWAVEAHPTLGQISVHAGSIGTFYSMTVLIPGRNRAVSISCNCYSDGAIAQIDKLLMTIATAQP